MNDTCIQEEPQGLQADQEIGQLSCYPSEFLSAFESSGILLKKVVSKKQS
jgi:hypothetical protein